jgi:hypothetical protein
LAGLDAALRLSGDITDNLDAVDRRHDAGDWQVLT